jgi:ribose 5-phosphate isomerase B
VKVALGCDHAGFPLKGTMIAACTSAGYPVLDLGTFSTDPVDYPDVARAVGEQLQRGHAPLGILLCGSGVGVSIAANKMRGVRAAVCHDTYSAHQGVEHDNMNVLTLGARVIGPALASELVLAFLRARYSGEERHARRFHKVEQLEAELAGSPPP